MRAKVIKGKRSDGVDISIELGNEDVGFIILNTLKSMRYDSRPCAEAIQSLVDSEFKGESPEVYYVADVQVADEYLGMGYGKVLYKEAMKMVAPAIIIPGDCIGMGTTSEAYNVWKSLSRKHKTEGSGKGMAMAVRTASADEIPKIHRFVRFEDGTELFHTERDGVHYLMEYAAFSSLSYGAKAKGSKSKISRRMELMIENIQMGTGEYDHGMEIDTERLDAEGKKHFQIFLVPIFGSKLDWDKNTPEVTDEAEVEEQYDFHKMLERQIRTWRGGRSSLNLTKHRYWPKFHAMVVEAVKKAYGSKVTLYRGIWGDQAEDALKGKPIKIRKFNSWSLDKDYAHGFVSGRKNHGVQEYWLVLRKDYKADDVVFAPVRLPDYAPDPDIMESWMSGEREAVIEDQSGMLKGYRVYKKSRKKMSKTASVPRTLWHVSNKKFRRFSMKNSAQGILWFAKDKDDLVKDHHGASINSRKPIYLYEVKTTVKNPAGWDEYDKYYLQQIEDMGYDSIDLDDNFVVLDAKDVKIVDVTMISPGKTAAVRTAGLPKKLYHVTPYASKIKSQGFKVGMPQIFGDAGAKSGISFTADKQWAEDYKVALQYYILWAKDKLELDDLYAVGTDFGVSAGQVTKVIEEFDDGSGSKWNVKDAILRIGILSSGRLPWLVIQDSKAVKRLASLNVNQIEILEVTMNEEPDDYEYKSSEKEWRVYDLSILNDSRMKVAARPSKNYHDEIEELDYARPTTHRNMLDVAQKKKKRAARQRRAAGFASLKANDKLKVYHGTQLKQVPALINGFDADKKMPRHFNAPRHPGLFVAPALKDTGSFGSVVLEITVKADELHGTDYGGNVMDEDKEWDWLAEKYPDSFRPGLSYSLDRKRAEPQAILRGRVAPSQIKRVNHGGKWYSRRDFLELIEEKDAGMDLSSPDYDIDEFFDLLAESRGMPRKRLVDGFRRLSPEKREWQLENFNFGPAAIRSYLKKMAREFDGEREARQRMAADFTKLGPNDRMVVYHTTRDYNVPKMINGFDGSKVAKRDHGGYSRGVFVSPDVRGVHSIRGAMLEIVVKAKELHGTNYGAQIQTDEVWADKYPDSFRPGLTMSLTGGPEPQALIIGRISPSQIKRVKPSGGKWMSRKEFTKTMGVRDMGMDLSNPDYTMDEFFELLGKGMGIPKGTLEKSFKRMSDWDKEQQLERLGFGQKAVRSYLKKMAKEFDGHTAGDMLVLARELVALDCDKFNDDYAKLMRQYHTMSGPGKRPMKKTLDVMERRLRDECVEKEEESAGGIQFIREKNDPDRLWMNSDSGDGYTFTYFPKTNQLVKGDVSDTHWEIVLGQLNQINPQGLGKARLKRMAELIESWDTPTSTNSRRTNQFFNSPVRITRNWDDFVVAMKGNKRKDRMSIMSVVLGRGGGRMGKNVILGRTGVAEMGGDEHGASFWNKISKSMMLQILKKVKDKRVDRVWLWN